MNQTYDTHGLASLVQSRGRNGDTMLVHMAPEEVQGLQSLALAHGGQLTINPETGLYEANFLKKLLPSIIGLALAPLTAGTSLAFLGNPLVAGALVGGVEGLRTGDLGKGLMAGLGAFGGASLGAGLSAAAGTAGATGTGAASTAGNLTAEQIAAKAIKDAGTFGYGNVVPQAAQATTSAATQAAGTQAAGQGFFNTMGSGIQALANPAGRTAFMNAVPGGMMGVAAGGMGLANAMTPDMNMPEGFGNIDDSYYESYGYSPEQGRFLGGRWRRGYPGFPPVGMADGGEVSSPQLQQYYQSLLAPPVQKAADPSFNDYMQGLNKFITSPIPPPPPPKTGVAPPPDKTVATGGGETTGGGGGMRWDPTQGRFVPGGGGSSPGDAYNDLSELQNLVNSGMFPGFNFGDLGNYLNTSGYGNSSALTWDPTSGTFRQPGSQTVNTPPGTGMGDQSQFNMNPYQMNPFVDGFDMNSLPGYGQNMGMPQGNLTDINRFSEPMYSGMDFGMDYGMPGYAHGGRIQRAAAGKLITGDGDGMSDDIRANINGEQEARLADGEFVIPADVVSHLGNGSTDAGAEELYEMMNRIREARTGNTEQAPEIDPDEFLPA